MSIYKLFFLITSLAWGLLYYCISDYEAMQASFIALLGVVSVGYLHYIIFSIFYSKKYKEHKSVKNLYDGLLRDLFNPISTGVVLFGIFYFTDRSYSSNSIDIASFAIGFFTSSLQEIWSAFNKKIAGLKLRKSALLGSLSIIVILFLLSIYSFILVYEGNYSFIEGVWIQFTATLLSFYAYVESKKITSVFNNGGYIYFPDGLFEFFRLLNHEPKLILALKENSERINKQTKIRKAKISAKKRRK
jgi:hypothetical protein